MSFVLPFVSPFVLTFVGAPARARAESPPIPFRVEAELPDGCPPAARFSAEVTSRTPRVRLAAPGEVARVYQLHVAPPPPLFLGRLEIPGADAREVTASSCAEVVSALALTLALALDPAASTAPIAPPPEAPTPSRPDARPSRLVAIGGEVALGLFADPLWGASIAGETRVGRAALRLRARYLQGLQSPEVARARVHLGAVGGEGCAPLPLAGALAVSPCLGFEAGGLLARGAGFDHPRTASLFWAAAAALARLAWAPPQGLGVEVEAGLLLPLVRPRLLAEAPPAPPREAVAARQVGFTAAARVSYRFR